VSIVTPVYSFGFSPKGIFMKKVLAVFPAMLCSVAFAQSAPRHMVDFSANSLIQTTLSFQHSKVRGEDGDNDTQLDINLNYAYALPMVPRLQLGTKINYDKGTDTTAGDYEDYGFKIGAIFNLSDWNSMDQVDLMNSVYASLYLGLNWANEYSGVGDRKNETRTTTLALGKRWDFKRWNLGHLTYSPEIALDSSNSTTGSSLEYAQSLQFRFLQFSLFW
jgi:hypothetical protein